MSRTMRSDCAKPSGIVAMHGICAPACENAT